MLTTATKKTTPLSREISVHGLNKTFKVQISEYSTVTEVESIITEQINISEEISQSNGTLREYKIQVDGSVLGSTDLVYPLAHFGKRFEYSKPKKQSKKSTGSVVRMSSTAESPRTLNPRIKRRKKSTTHTIAGFFSAKPMTKKDKRPEAIVAQIEALKLELSAMGCPYVPSKANVHSVEIIERIGKGSSSIIYSVFVDGWICAMKVVPMTREEMQDVGNGISQEIEVLEQLPPHPNVVQYLFHQREEEAFRIFLKQYQFSLDKEIARRRETKNPFSVTEILLILQDISSGIYNLHANNIIHRDIKSHNIFVQTNKDSPDDSQPTYVVGDLDSAKMVTRRTAASTVIGTPAFMAPEVLTSEGEVNYSFSADVFSFGMLIFELLTLQIPYHELRTFEVAGRIIKGEPPQFPNSLRAEFEPLRQLHLECIKFDAPKRPTARQICSRVSAMKYSAERSRTVFSHSSDLSLS